MICFHHLRSKKCSRMAFIISVYRSNFLPIIMNVVLCLVFLLNRSRCVFKLYMNSAETSILVLRHRKTLFLNKNIKSLFSLLTVLRLCSSIPSNSLLFIFVCYNVSKRLLCCCLIQVNVVILPFSCFKGPLFFPCFLPYKTHT